MWTFKTRYGTLKIMQLRNGRFGLYMNDEMLGSYHSPHAAADDVHMCSTGCWEWDQQLTVVSPCDLSEWQSHQR